MQPILQLILLPIQRTATFLASPPANPARPAAYYARTAAFPARPTAHTSNYEACQHAWHDAHMHQNSRRNPVIFTP